MRGSLRFLLGIEAAVDELLKQRMIERDLLEAALAQTIQPRITDVCDRDAVVIEQTT